MTIWTEVHPAVYRHTSTAHSYALRRGETAVLVGLGDGSVLDDLPEIGVREVATALLTHAHADVAGGTARAVAAGIAVYAPESERPFLERPQDFIRAWLGDNNYDGRPLHLCVPQGVATLPLRDYRPLTVGGFTFTPRPAPGPSAGHSALLCELEGVRLAFTGALLSGAGQVPRLSATMWGYNGGEGLAGSVLSLLDLAEQVPDLLLGAFGPPLAPAALGRTAARLHDLLSLRRHNPRLLEWRETPYRVLRPWLLANRTSVANSYILRAESGRALLVDFGYDFMFGAAPGSGRESRRPWLYTLPTLLKRFGITGIDAVIPTHPHDDHVAGISLLREVHGAELWAAEPMADVLARPERHRLPCRWFEALTPDRVLALDTPMTWEEFCVTPHALPGHAGHAVALLVEGHGERLLFTGDQYADADALGLNYTYQNDFSEGDYLASARLIGSLRPDLLLSGHWEPVIPDVGWAARALERGAALQRLHAEAQPTISRLGLTTRVVADRLTITLHNPTGAAFRGRLRVEGAQERAVAIAAGTTLDCSCAVPGPPRLPPRLRQVTLHGEAGEPPLISYVEC